MCTATNRLKVERGEVYWFDFEQYATDASFINKKGDYAKTHLMLKSRPYIVVGKYSGDLCTISPISSSTDRINHFFRVPIKLGDEYWEKAPNIDFKDSAIISNNILTVDIDALGDYIGKVSSKVLDELSLKESSYFDIRFDSMKSIYEYMDELFRIKYNEFKNKILEEQFKNTSEMANTVVANIKNLLQQPVQASTIEEKKKPGRKPGRKKKEISISDEVVIIKNDDAQKEASIPDEVVVNNDNEPRAQTQSFEQLPPPIKETSNEKIEDVSEDKKPERIIIKRLPNKRWTAELNYQFMEDYNNPSINKKTLAKMYSVKEIMLYKQLIQCRNNLAG